MINYLLDISIVHVERKIYIAVEKKNREQKKTMRSQKVVNYKKNFVQKEFVHSTERSVLASL